MNNLNQLSHSLKDTLENVTDGWQHLWQRARNAITHFTPLSSSSYSDGISKSSGSTLGGTVRRGFRKQQAQLKFSWKHRVCRVLIFRLA